MLQKEKLFFIICYLIIHNFSSKYTKKRKLEILICLKKIWKWPKIYNKEANNIWWYLFIFKINLQSKNREYVLWRLSYKICQNVTNLKKTKDFVTKRQLMNLEVFVLVDRVDSNPSHFVIIVVLKNSFVV